MLRGRTAAIATALVVAATAAVTAGCGSSRHAHALALDPVASSAAKTQQAGAARIRLSLALSSPRLGQGRSFAVRGTGAIDGTRAELTLGLGALLHSAGLPTGANGTVKEIFLRRNDDYVLYVKSGLAAAYLPGGKQWVELDVSKLGKSAGLDVGQLLSGSPLQPSDLLSMLKGEGAKVRTVGPATVDGVSTTQYRVTIDVAKALQARGASPLLGAAAAQAPTIPADVWIGKDGLVRRIKVSYGVAHTHAAMTMDLYDYGAHVTIAAPPSSSVVDATQLVESGIGSGFTH
jgi:LppX_LprAFG lipoprotein